MGQDAKAAIGFGVEVHSDVYDSYGLVNDAKEALARRMGLESASPYCERSEPEETLYQKFQEQWEEIGIKAIEGGSYDYPDVVLVADETSHATWWDGPGKMGMELDQPCVDEFKARLEKFLDLVEDPLEVDDDPQWYIVAFFG